MIGENKMKRNFRLPLIVGAENYENQKTLQLHFNHHAYIHKYS